MSSRQTSAAHLFGYDGMFRYKGVPTTSQNTDRRASQDTTESLFQPNPRQCQFHAPESKMDMQTILQAAVGCTFAVAVMHVNSLSSGSKLELQIATAQTVRVLDIPPVLHKSYAFSIAISPLETHFAVMIRYDDERHNIQYACIAVEVATGRMVSVLNEARVSHTGVFSDEHNIVFERGSWNFLSDVWTLHETVQTPLKPFTKILRFGHSTNLTWNVCKPPLQVCDAPPYIQKSVGEATKVAALFELCVTPQSALKYAYDNSFMCRAIATICEAEV